MITSTRNIKFIVVNSREDYVNIATEWILCNRAFFLLLLTVFSVVFQRGVCGCGSRGIADIRLPVLRGERGGALRRGVPGLPVASQGGEGGAATQGAPRQAQAGG